MNIQYKYPSNGFEYEPVEKLQKKAVKKVVKAKKEDSYKESVEVRLEHAFAQFVNQIYEMISTEEVIEIRKVEMFILNSLQEKFNKTEIAKLTGYSLRTIRNKCNGQQNLQ